MHQFTRAYPKPTCTCSFFFLLNIKKFLISFLFLKLTFFIHRVRRLASKPPFFTPVSKSSVQFHSFLQFLKSVRANPIAGVALWNQTRGTAKQFGGKKNSSAFWQHFFGVKEQQHFLTKLSVFCFEEKLTRQTYFFFFIDEIIFLFRFKVFKIEIFSSFYLKNIVVRSL